MTRPNPEARHKKGKHGGKGADPAPSPNPPAMRRKSRKKHTKEERRGSAAKETTNFEGDPKLTKMNPLANESVRQRPEAKREEVRAMKRMFDEGYNAVRENGPKTRPRLVILNFIFIILSIVKVFSNLALLAARFFVLTWGTFENDDTSTNFIYRVIVDASMVTIFFQIFMFFADCFLIYAMFKQNSKILIWLFGLSFCLTFFVLTLGALNLAIGHHSIPLAKSLTGSYLAASEEPMEAASKMFVDYECCGFDDPLDWLRERLFEWDSDLTDTRMTLQQNFSWVDECMEMESKKPFDNYLCAVPSICKLPNLKTKVNVSKYSRKDLRLLIREEGGIRHSLFDDVDKTILSQLRDVDGCINAIDRKIQGQNTMFIVSSMLIILVLPIQTFLITIVFVNDNAIGRMVVIDGEPVMEKLDKCSPLAFFKRIDQNMGVKHKKKHHVNSNSEES